MKILYVSFNVNHHQVPFVEALMQFVGKENVKYAAIHTFEQSRVQMGMGVYKADWIIDIKSERSIFENYWMSADVVLCNVRDFYELFEKRLKTGKLTFYYSERWFKEPFGLWRLLHPHILSLLFKYHTLSKYSNFYYLPQGYYAYGDLKKFNIFKNKAYKFGYITPTCDYSNEENGVQYLLKDNVNIIWAGKIHHVKRVDLLAKAFVNVYSKYPNCHLTIIGDGEEKAKVEKILEQLPADSYSLLSYVKNSVLHQYMRQADIYVFPSNGAEGWGAVVNESMTEGCAVVVSDKAGAISMIENGVNGLVFKSEDLKSLTQCIERLVCDKAYIESIKQAAKETIIKEWNATNAAKKFLQLCQSLENGKEFLCSSGVFEQLQ